MPGKTKREHQNDRNIRAIRWRRPKIWGANERNNAEDLLPKTNEIGCWTRGFLMLAPVTIDALIWWAAVATNNPGMLGVAFVGAPVSLGLSYAFGRME